MLSANVAAPCNDTISLNLTVLVSAPLTTVSIWILLRQFVKTSNGHSFFGRVVRDQIYMLDATKTSSGKLVGKTLDVGCPALQNLMSRSPTKIRSNFYILPTFQTLLFRCRVVQSSGIRCYKEQGMSLCNIRLNAFLHRKRYCTEDIVILYRGVSFPRRQPQCCLSCLLL